MIVCDFCGRDTKDRCLQCGQHCCERCLIGDVCLDCVEVPRVWFQDEEDDEEDLESPVVFDGGPFSVLAAPCWSSFEDYSHTLLCFEDLYR